MSRQRSWTRTVCSNPDGTGGSLSARPGSARRGEQRGDLFVPAVAGRAVRGAVEERLGEGEVGMARDHELDHHAPAVERGPDQRVVDEPVRVEPGTAGGGADGAPGGARQERP